MKKKTHACTYRLKRKRDIYQSLGSWESGALKTERRYKDQETLAAHLLQWKEVEEFIETLKQFRAARVQRKYKFWSSGYLPYVVEVPKNPEVRRTLIIQEGYSSPQVHSSTDSLHTSSSEVSTLDDRRVFVGRNYYYYPVKAGMLPAITERKLKVG